MKSYIPIAILTALAIFTGGCDKPASPPATSKQNTQPPPPIEAAAFHGEVYKSHNAKTVLTLVSKDECELAENGTTLLCKYTKADGKLRIVVTALGTSQVVYYRFTGQGIEDNEGNTLLSPSYYAAYIAELERQQQEELKAQERKRMEEQRVARAIADSVVETRTIATFPLASRGIFDGFNNRLTGTRETSCTITDVSLKQRAIARAPSGIFTNDTTVLFSKVQTISEVGTGYFGVLAQVPDFVRANAFVIFAGGNDSYPDVFQANSTSEAQAVHAAVVSAFNAWKTKFPEAVWK